MQAHISVSHKHLDVKLPNTTTDEATNGDSNNITPSWHAAMQDFEPYKCTVCNKGFQKMSKLTAHMKIHRSEKGLLYYVFSFYSLTIAETMYVLYFVSFAFKSDVVTRGFTLLAGLEDHSTRYTFKYLTFLQNLAIYVNPQIA